MNMLTTRPSKRDKVGFLNRDLMYDLLEGDVPVGSLVYMPRTLSATIAIGDQKYSVARVSDRPDERLYQALIRIMTGSEKPPVNPWALKDEAGRTLALAEEVKRGFAVSRADESFSFRKGTRPYHLYRDGHDRPLGSVGQATFFTRTLHMDLPAEFDPAFQVFLLTLLLSLTMKQLDSSSSYSA
ncbi:MAG: hypothetical protein JSR90_10005 [Proteobacteria bacterium]|nr:hypothetical protein [Pseudomonadota bacterium]